MQDSFESSDKPLTAIPSYQLKFKFLGRWYQSRLTSFKTTQVSSISTTVPAFIPSFFDRHITYLFIYLLRISLSIFLSLLLLVNSFKLRLYDLALSKRHSIASAVCADIGRAPVSRLLTCLEPLQPKASPSSFWVRPSVCRAFLNSSCVI